MKYQMMSDLNPVREYGCGWFKDDGDKILLKITVKQLESILEGARRGGFTATYFGIVPNPLKAGPTSPDVVMFRTRGKNCPQK